MLIVMLRDLIPRAARSILMMEFGMEMLQEIPVLAAFL